MPTPLVVNGVTYQYPKSRDKFWGSQATGWATAVTAVTSTLFAPTLPVATTGQIRLGNGNSIAFRNFGNTANTRLFVDGSDRLIYDDGVTQKDLSLTGGGNVQHLAASVDNTIPRFDGVVGTVLQESAVTIDDSNNISTPGSITASAVDLLAALVPIGTIIPHYDFNAGLPAPAAPYWVPCDGGTYTIGGSPRTTPDLSNRYLVGFGTEAGGDIAGAVFSTTPVGNANHQLTVVDHTHDVNPPNTTSTSGGSHNHGSGTLVAQITTSSSDSRIDLDRVATTAWTSSNRVAATGDTGAAGGSFTTGADVGGSTSTDGSHTHDVNIPTFASAADGGFTQSAQPRSIRVRFFMRAK